MKTRTIHHPKDFVSREIRLGGAIKSHPNAGRPDAGRVARDHVVFGQPRIDTERSKAARIFGAAKQREAAMRHAGAMIEARGEVFRARYVPEDGREEVTRIMVERGLSVGDAYEAWAAASPSLPVGSRGGRIGG